MTEEMKLPKSVRVGFRTYNIESIDEVGRAEGANGLHLGDQHIIRVACQLPASEQAMVLMHEILHGVWEINSLDEVETKSITEELICRVYGNQLTQVFQDNPKIMDWIGTNARSK